MISVSLQGLQRVVESIRRLPTSIDSESVFSEAADEFASVLSGRTPPGWNLKLGDSVLSQRVDGAYLTGYDVGVETAGNKALDGRRKRTRWASVDELETVLQASIDEFLGSFSGSVLTGFADEVDSVLP